MVASYLKDIREDRMCLVCFADGRHVSRQRIMINDLDADSSLDVSTLGRAGDADKISMSHSDAYLNNIAVAHISRHGVNLPLACVY